VTMAAGMRAATKAAEYPPEPKVGAPVLDPNNRAAKQCTNENPPRRRGRYAKHLVR